MKDKAFIDTNIFIYAHLEERGNEKCKIAGNFLRSPHTRIVVSVQVLNEYYSVMLRNSISDSVIQEKLINIIDVCTVAELTVETVKKAWEIRQRYKFSYWDSLIVASALENGCSFLHSEDMQHEQVIEKSLTIVNPFKNTSPDKTT